MSVLAFGIIAAGLYLYLVPGASANIPFSSPLGISHHDSIDDGCPVVGPEEKLLKTDLQSGPCSQEMVDITGEGDTLYLLLNANLLDENLSKIIAEKLAAAIQSVKKSFDANTPLKPGRSYSVTIDQDGNFLRAMVEYDPANVFHAALKGSEIQCWKEDAVLDYKTEAICFQITGTLEQSLRRVGEGGDLPSKLAKVFQYDIDFERESSRGDTCKILFQRKYADDRPSGYGDILAAVYKGKWVGPDRKPGEKVAILFKDEYYDEKGTELKKSLLRSPLRVMRMTSAFQKNRFHPIQRIRRHHMGTDYAAPQGTPAHSVANGVVTFAGSQNGYGNLVCIKHANGYETKYGHLHRVYVQKGQPVKQDKIIGLVGRTGDATGPHLHFELIQNGIYLNPESRRKEMVEKQRTVPTPLMTRFGGLRDQRLTPLEGNMVLIKTADRGSATATR